MNDGRLRRTGVRILVCEADERTVRALRMVLRDADLDVVVARSVEEALDCAALSVPDAAIVGLALPDGDGIELCAQLREWSAMALVLLLAIDDEDEKVRALETGADDCVMKPFAPRELVARLRAILRRAGEDAVEPRVELDGLQVDLASHALHRAGAEVHLTPIEVRLLRTLLRHRGRLLTHDALLRQVWGPAYVHETQTLRAHNANLRRKMDPAQRYIRTEHGVGYRFANAPREAERSPLAQPLRLVGGPRRPDQHDVPLRAAARRLAAGT